VVNSVIEDSFVSRELQRFALLFEEDLFASGLLVFSVNQ